MAVLTPVLTGGNGVPTYNLGIAETYSWIPIQNDQNRPMFARAGYIVNLSDLQITLSASNLNIGSVKIQDGNSGALADVVQAGTNNALLVQTQDFTSTVDSITIGDVNGKTAYVTSSALNTYTINPITSVSANVVNQLSATILNSSIEISNDVGNAVPVTITNSLSTTPVGTQLVTFADGPQLDGNRRLRVALPSQGWWYVSSVDKDGDLRLIESLTPGASSIFVQNLASVTMTPGLSSTGSVIRASRRRFKIRPGVSHQWTGTVNFDGQDIGTIKRLGTFTNFNGMFFELSGTDFNVVVRRRLTDGTLYEERVNRNDFNGDKLDGNGLSQQNWSTVLSGSITAGTNRWAVAIPGDGTVYNAEFTYTNSALSAIKPGAKATIQGVTPSGYNQCIGIAAINTTTNKLTATYVIDPGVLSNASTAKIVNTPYHNAHTFFFEFNGGRTAQVHFGLNATGGPTYLHTFDFSNQLGLQYESAPALMERKEILNYQTMNYIPSMTIDGTSFTVEAEAELNPGFGVAKNNNYLSLDSGSPPGGNLNEYPLLALGLRAGEPYQRADIQVQSIDIVDINNIGGSNNGGAIAWRLLLNPTLSGTLPTPTNIGKCSRQWAYTTTNHTTSGVNLSAGANSQGIELLAGYSTSTATIDVKTALNFLNMGSNIDYSDADKVVLMVKQLSPAAKDAYIVATVNFIEAL
jgi:hypothetical protein